MKYRMIGIDMDGTLLNEQGDVSPANRRAIEKAKAAGVMVVPCTGRGWREAMVGLLGAERVRRSGIRQAAQAAGADELIFPTVGVFNTGALVAEVATGEHVDLAIIEPHLAKELVDALADEPEAVLLYRESNLAGHDYLVTGRGELIGNTQWWFEATGAKVHVQREVTAEDLHHTLRVGMVVPGDRIEVLTEKIESQFRGRVFCHGFGAVKQKDERDRTINVLEIFAAGVDKWRGIRWIADQHGIAWNQIACIGDEINDVAMLREAGLGVAMANAVPSAKAVADVQTAANTEDGVSLAIEKMLEGVW